MAEIVEQQILEENVNVKYPQVEGLPNRDVQGNINEQIRVLVQRLMDRQGYNRSDLAEMVGQYKIGINEHDVLSLYLENYSIFEMAAHGLTLADSLTVNLQTGQSYQLSDLFKINSSYRLIISDRIKEEVKKRDIPLINPFNRINDDQQFYLTDNGMVIYWQQYEYTPGYVGIPMFRIPYNILTNVINPEGPLAPIVNLI